MVDVIEGSRSSRATRRTLREELGEDGLRQGKEAGNPLNLPGLAASARRLAEPPGPSSAALAARAGR